MFGISQETHEPLSATASERPALGFRPRTALFAALALCLWLAGCDNGAGTGDVLANASAGACVPGNEVTADQCGTVLVSLTDAEGDLISYVVDVEFLRLHTATGDRIEVLPAPTRVDFAALGDVSELVSVALVPPGVYTGGSITLNYADAEVYVEAGGDVVAARIVDDAGHPLHTVTVDISLAAGDPLTVFRQQTATLTVDFDLAVSHEVDTSVSPPLVAARPFIVAEVHPVIEKPLRVRGALASVDTQSGVYTVRVRPWHRPGGSHGVMRIITTDDTRFDVNGTLYMGGDGLRALAQLPLGTLTTAAGTLDITTRRFTADRVHAGDSVPGAQSAAIHGNVIARDGDVLVVGAALSVRPGHGERVYRRVNVAIGYDTRVYVLARPPVLLDTAAISIGQRVVAFGSWSDASADEPGTPYLDATDGRVRMDPTRLRGTVTDVQAGQVNLALRAIDRLGIGLFDFSGTGMVSDLDADPADYRVATGGLALAGIELDQPISIAGFPLPFGAAPPDFQARAMATGPSAVAAVLGIGWGVNGTRAPFAGLGPDGIVLDLTNPDIGLRHHLKVGANLVSLKDLQVSPLILPAQGRTLYGIQVAGQVELYRDFSGFSQAVSRHLGDGRALQSLAAYGGYDRGENLFPANRIWVHVVQP